MVEGMLICYTILKLPTVIFLGITKPTDRGRKVLQERMHAVIHKGKLKHESVVIRFIVSIV